MKTVSEKGDRAVSRDLACGRRSGGTVAHSSKLKSKLQIGAPGKEHRNLTKNARILLFFLFGVARVENDASVVKYFV